MKKKNKENGGKGDIKEEWSLWRQGKISHKQINFS